MKKIIILTTMLLVFTIVISCAQQANHQASRAIQIGVLAVLSGEAAEYGLAVKDGLDLALKEINQSGGLLNQKVQLIYEDSRLDTKLGTNIVNKFINIDQLPVIISAEGSGVTSSVAPLIEQNKKIMLVTIASTPELKNAGDYIFRVIPSDAAQGKQMAQTANKLGHKSTAILFVNDAYGIGIKDIFTSNFNGQTLNTEPFEAGTNDFKPQLTKTQPYNPDVLIVAARKEYPRILKQIQELEITAQIITSETFKNENMLKEIGQSAEGVVTHYYSPTIDYANYKTKYQQEYGKQSPIYSDYGYDSLMVLAQAIQRAGALDTQKIKDKLYATDYKGATGIIKFDEYGEVTDKPFTTYRVLNGEFVELKL